MNKLVSLYFMIIGYVLFMSSLIADIFTNSYFNVLMVLISGIFYYFWLIMTLYYNYKEKTWVIKWLMKNYY